MTASTSSRGVSANTEERESFSHGRQRDQHRGAAPHPAGEVVDHLPFGARLPGGGDDGLGGLAERRWLQRLERQREVVALVHRRGGQHVVAVRECLVDVEVDADHQVQGLQCCL